MAFSIIQTTATGSTNAFPINFTLGFNNRNEVTCQVNDEVDGLGDPVYRSLDWVNDGLVNVLPATLIPAATKVVFKRTVSKTALAHDYANGEAIDEINLDESNKQNLMAIHELFDGRFTSPFQQDLDMGTHKITNLVDGINPKDAVNFGQLNGLSGGAGNGLYLDVTGTQVQDDSLLWDTTAVKFIRRSLSYLKTQLGIAGITAFGTSLVSAANAAAGLALLGAAPTVSPTFTGTPIVPTASLGTNNTQAASTAFVLANGGAGKVQNFRLSLTSLTPVTTSDVTGAITIYCTPYKGNQIALYNGSTWVNRTSAEFSLALGTLVAGKPYDVFCYDNAGVPTLEFLVWTNDTTRATALVYQDGVLVKSGAATRRYLGTFYTTSTTTTEDSLVKRCLYNYYNRVVRPMRRTDPTPTWNYTTNTLRQANGSAANVLDFVQGVAEDTVSATAIATARNTVAGTLLNIGIGVDSTTVNSSITGIYRAPISAYEVLMSANYEGTPGIGIHHLVWLEQSGAAGTTTWNGDQGSTISGITGRVMA